MKLSIVLSLQPIQFLSLIYQGKTEDRFQKIKTLGYDGVELAVRDPSLLDWNHLEESIRNCGLKNPTHQRRAFSTGRRRT